MLRIISWPVVALLLAQSAGQAPRPDFSGRWVLDQQHSTSIQDGKMVIRVVGMLGERFTAEQTSKTLTLKITAFGREFTAVYNLDGSPSRLTSPTAPGQPDEEIVSYATWEGETLVVRTTTAEELNGKPVQMTTRRKMWIDPEGFLVLERTGTPVELVSPSRSVYRREGKE